MACCASRKLFEVVSIGQDAEKRNNGDGDAFETLERLRGVESALWRSGYAGGV